MKNLFQLVPEKKLRESLITDLKYTRNVILQSSDNTKVIDPNDLCYAGFLILKLSDLQNTSSSKPFTHEEVAALNEDFQQRAFKNSKLKDEDFLNLSDKKKYVAQETIDLKYAAKLIYGWATKNEKVSPKDALYIGFLLHTKYRVLTGLRPETMANHETLTAMAEVYHQKAEQFRKQKLQLS